MIAGVTLETNIALTLAVNRHPRVAGIALIGGSSRLVVTDAILDGLQNHFEPTIDNIVKYSWFKNTSAFFKEKNRQRALDAGQEVVYNDFLACRVPLEASSKMADAIDDATFVGLENYGHYQHIEQTSRVADELASLLQAKLGA